MRIYTHKERIRNKDGYVLIYMPEHPRAVKNRVFEHIVVWEKEHNMTIPDGYVVHHINGIKNDNRIENLLMMSVSEHIVLHHTNKKRSAETRRKISEKQINRLKDPRNHPKYKEVPIDDIVRLIESGETVKNVCQKYNICKCTYYKKLKERGIK